MDDKQNQKDKLLKIIANLEIEIAMWNCNNSQSNPGAYMQLRSMKRNLELAKQALKYILSRH